LVRPPTETFCGGSETYGLETMVSLMADLSVAETGVAASASVPGDPPISPADRAFLGSFPDNLLELEDDKAIVFFSNEETRGLLFQSH
jgi:hypothetical protein